MYVPPEEDVVHPYLKKWKELAKDEKEKFNIAASMQAVTEKIIFDTVNQVISACKAKGLEIKNICFSGGVSLNSVAIGKVKSVFKDIDGVFVPPVPYDGGLSIGACQYHWHNVLGNERNFYFVSPYLGEDYSLEDVNKSLDKKSKDLVVETGIALKDCVRLLTEKNIVSIFQGRSESGRRALGNRSILADPRSPDMKDLINQKVKHRQWYRPFAPTILEEDGKEWFENFHSSPYMGFVFKFKKEKLGITPAVEHVDESARLQSVNEQQNKPYHDLITEFKKQTGVPIILNTSFNDREPICETPDHAVSCFLGTDIDYLYFPEYEILVKKK